MRKWSGRAFFSGNSAPFAVSNERAHEAPLRRQTLEAIFRVTLAGEGAPGRGECAEGAGPGDRAVSWGPGCPHGVGRQPGLRVGGGAFSRPLLMATERRTRSGQTLQPPRAPGAPVCPPAHAAGSEAPGRARRTQAGAQGVESAPCPAGPRCAGHVGPATQRGDLQHLQGRLEARGDRTLGPRGGGQQMQGGHGQGCCWGPWGPGGRAGGTWTQI